MLTIFKYERFTLNFMQLNSPFYKCHINVMRRLFPWMVSRMHMESSKHLQKRYALTEVLMDKFMQLVLL